MTEEEFLAREASAETRSEYFHGEIFEMSGGTSDHAKITMNLARRIANQLEGKPCFPLVNDMMIKIEATGLLTYPDIVVVCEEKYKDATERVLLTPSVLIEVTSDSTERYDRTTKLRHYKLIPSLREYLVVAQSEPVIDIYSRLPDESWGHSSVAGLEASLSIFTIDVHLPLTSVYERVNLPDFTDGPRPR